MRLNLEIGKFYLCKDGNIYKIDKIVKEGILALQWDLVTNKRNKSEIQYVYEANGKHVYGNSDLIAEITIHKPEPLVQEGWMDIRGGVFSGQLLNYKPQGATFVKVRIQEIEE